MCIVLVAWHARPDAPLVLAANRDEYHERGTRAAAWWPDAPAVFGGRDLLHGGTWLAVHRAGRFAVVTNVRDPSPRRPGTRSRGLLVSDYVLGGQDPGAFLRAVAASAGAYDAFNLLVGDADGLWFLGSREPEPLALGAGIHGISNGALDSPWPKVARGRDELQRLLSGAAPHEPQVIEEIFRLLANRDMPPDESLPDTGVGLEWERRLAPLFVQAGDYGTRSSTVIVRRARGGVQFHERSFDRQGRATAEARELIAA